MDPRSPSEELVQQTKSLVGKDCYIYLEIPASSTGTGGDITMLQKLGIAP